MLKFLIIVLGALNLMARLEYFRALKYSNSESFRALKLSNSENFRALKIFLFAYIALALCFFIFVCLECLCQLRQFEYFLFFFVDKTISKGALFHTDAAFPRGHLYTGVSTCATTSDGEDAYGRLGSDRSLWPACEHP